MKVRRSDEGRGQRRRWAFFSNLLMTQGASGGTISMFSSAVALVTQAVMLKRKLNQE